MTSDTIFSFHRTNKNTTIHRTTQTKIDKYFQSRRKNQSDTQESEQYIFGDAPPHNKGNYTRLVSLNVNGISRRDQYAKLHMIGQTADSYQCDFIGMIETNLDYKYEDVKAQCHGILRRYFKQTNIIEASSDLQFNRAYQPGGVLSVMTFPWASRCKTSRDSSNLGRWTETTITGKKQRKITILTAYVVCPQSETEVTTKNTTAYTQQWHLLKRKFPGRSIDSRKIMMTDLKERILELKRLGHELVIFMDANDSLQQLNSDLTSWVSELELIDVITDKHGTEDEPATHARGSQRIDYMFATDKINEYVYKCGILQFNEFCFSNHRPIFADVDFKAFLGGDLPDMTNRNMRLVHSNDPRSVIEFQTSLKHALDESKLECRIKDLKDIIDGNIESDINVEEEMEAIDSEFTKIRLDCEKKSGQTCKLPWSPKLKEANNTIMFWSLWLSQSRSRGKHNFHEARQKFVNATTLPFADMEFVSRKIIFYQLQKAYDHLKEYRMRAKELREEYLEERAKMAADGQDKELHQIIINIKKAETRREMFAKLRRLKNKRISSGISNILIEDEEGAQISITDPDDMVKAIIAHNKSHFSQADGTPFTIDPLKSLFGTCATNEASQSIVDGTMDVELLGLPEATEAILLQMGRNVTESTIDTNINTDDVIRGYQRWSEYTSTSPSGLHLGLDKAMLRFRKTQEKEAMLSNTSPLYERYFDIKTFIINSALKTGYVYKRWRKVINALIEKIPGLPLASKIRIIHLIESDFNFMTGTIFGRRMIWAGEDINAFHEGQGGSRPSRRTQELLLIKHFNYATLRLSKANGASFDNDAKSCFDRIVMPVASLAAQQIGMPPAACEIFLKTLHHMRYHVKTVHGVSEQSYGTTSDHTIHGPGQGGRGSPSVSVIVSSLIMHCMSQKSKGFTIVNPYDRDDKFVTWMTGFVDDVTHWCSSANAQSEEDAINELQRTAQWWEQLLHATGGKLELSKCFFYIIQWDFDTEGVAYIRPKSKFNQIVVLNNSETNLAVIIPQKEPYEAHKTLGIMERPDGNNKEEFERLSKKSLSMAQRIVTKKLSTYEAQLFYFTTYLPGMSYGFAVGTFSKNQLDTIQRGVTQHFSSAMGFVRSIPNEVKFGPKSLGGIGMRCLFAEQGTEKCTSIIRYSRCNRPVRDSLMTYLQWCQKIAGTSISILENTSAKLPQLDEEKWMCSIREFLNESKLQIHIPQLHPDKLQRDKDQYIIDYAIHLGFQNIDLERINRCRIFLRATTVSDITNASGTRIDEDAVNCSYGGQIIDRGKWPIQPQPGKVHLDTWRKFIVAICTVSDHTLLEVPLGDWNDEPIRHRSSQTHFIDPSTMQIFIRSETKWQQGTISGSKKHSIVRELHDISDEVDTTRLLPVDVVESHPNKIKWRDRLCEKMWYMLESKWYEYIDSLPEWEQILTYQVTTLIDETEILELMADAQVTLHCASDGSVMNDNATYGWVISIGTKHIATGKGYVPGFPRSSLRSEACGKLAWITWLQHFVKFHEIGLKCVIQSYCDNKTVVSRTVRTNDYKNPTYTMSPNFDIFKTIYEQQIRLPDTSILDTAWVKGHQDAGTPIHELSLQAQLNIYADKLASEAYEDLRLRKLDSTEYLFPNGTAWIIADGRAQNSQEIRLLRWRFAELELQKYYSSKILHVKIDELHMFNWAGLRIARSKMSSGEQSFSIKQMIGWLPTGHKTKQYGQLVNNCIHCQHPDETVDHLWLCPSRSEQNKIVVDEFVKYLIEEGTDDDIISAMALGLRQWFKITKRDTIIERKEKLFNLMDKQRQIGWNFFIRGLLLNDWAYWQEKANERGGRSQMGDSWSANITSWWIRQSRKIWNIRNEKLHDTAKENISRAEEEAHEQVRRLYKSAHLLSATDKELFSKSIEDMMNQPLASLRIWIETAWPTVKNCIQHQTERLLRQNQRMTEFMTTDSNLTDETVEFEEIVDYNLGGQEMISGHQESMETLVHLDNQQENERILIYEVNNNEISQQTLAHQQHMIDGQ